MRQIIEDLEYRVRNNTATSVEVAALAEIRRLDKKYSDLKEKMDQIYNSVRAEFRRPLQSLTQSV